VIQYDLKSKHEVMGAALHVSLPKNLKSGTAIDVTVLYKTTKDCTALQWLDKEYAAFGCNILDTHVFKPDAGETIPISLQSVPAHPCAGSRSGAR
jgi:hypothetical protein